MFNDYALQVLLVLLLYYLLLNYVLLLCAIFIMFLYLTDDVFIDNLNNTMIELPIYYNSHMRIDEQITNIIPK